MVLFALPWPDYGPLETFGLFDFSSVHGLLVEALDQMAAVDRARVFCVGVTRFSSDRE